MSKASYYDRNRDALFERYDGLNPAKVHQQWVEKHLAKEPGFACDIGAGSGRDANWLAEKGWEVLAIEPGALRELAQRKAHPRVTWLDDSLPELRVLRTLGRRFDLILLSAVWMHVAPSTRERAFRILTELLNPSGLFEITLRHGSNKSEKRAQGFHPVRASELIRHGRSRPTNLRGQ